MDYAQFVDKKIATKKAIVGVIGMGYVGKGIADIISKRNFQTIGFVRSENNTTHNLKNKNLEITTDSTRLRTCDVILICVQTPIDWTKAPDLKYLKTAARQIATNLRKGQLIIIESSIAVGTTREVVLPILKQSTLKAGKDFFLAFSPERVDPGNTQFPIDQIPKVVAGLDEQSQHLATSFYEKIMDQVVPVSSLETAELVKLFENTFRLVNISLVNQMNAYAKKRNINMWEVIYASATKPFGFLAHYPSPGAGGHCIPVDPYYLLDGAKMEGIKLTLIEEAARINDAQPQKIVDRAVEILKSQKIYYQDFIDEYIRIATTSSQPQYKDTFSFKYAGLKGGRSSHKLSRLHTYKILLLGIAYKPDIDDIRESPALKIWEQMEDLGCLINYHDPYIRSYKDKESQPLTPSFVREQNLVIITTNHSIIDYKKLETYGVPILDTRNVYSGKKSSHIYGL